MSDPRELAAALRALRRRQGFQQGEVAERMGRSPATVSRLEQDGVNPQWRTLLRYLDAIDVTLDELVAELSRPGDVPDALDEQLEREAKRLEAEPGYRRLAAEMLNRFGGDELPQGLLALAEMLDAHGERIRQLEERVGSGAGGEDVAPNGTDGSPVEG